MATLFFDGFDRGTAIGRLDPQYWSTQYRTDPGYALGGYSYNHSSTNYVSQYKTVSINNGTIPSGLYHASGDWTNGFSNIAIADNGYPGFGSPPGFLALSNIPINDTNFLAPISYIQLSGFNQASGNKTYFGARFLGLETKHTDYDSRVDPSRSDKPGRFDYRHPLLAFCSGSSTGLLLSIVKTTGNHLALLDNQKMTMGLQVEQNGQILGIFDMNLNDTIDKYKVISVHSTDQSNTSNSLNNMVGKVLTIADIRSAAVPFNFSPGVAQGQTLVSRWSHLEFLIDKSSNYLSLKIEGVDVPIIDIDDTNSDKNTWPIELPISGFSYDNIKFFNRTYYKNWLQSLSPINSNTQILGKQLLNNFYYNEGSVTLIDDVTLIDNAGNQPSFWLGPTAKVIPLSPGISTNLDNNGTINDGLTEWVSNVASQRIALKNFDGDVGILETSNSGAISAVRFDNHNFGADTQSIWRTSFNDGIGGIKVYNHARKNFLDTDFINVFFTGIADNQAEYTQLLINTDREIYDVTNKTILSKLEPVVLSYDIKKFNNPSIYFTNNETYLYTSYGDLYRTDLGGFNNQCAPTHPAFPSPNNFFTIESWVYFANGNENITLYSKKPPASYPAISNIRLDVPYTNFDIVCTTGYLQYNTYVDDNLVTERKFYFQSPISTGSWNHVALVNESIEDFRGRIETRHIGPNTAITPRVYANQYRLVTYLNGVSGTRYNINNSLDTNLAVYQNNTYNWFPEPNTFSPISLSVSGLGVISIVPSEETANITTVSVTGILDEFYRNIRVPTDRAWTRANNTSGSPPLSITETRCNNRIAYTITSAASSSLTGLYCYAGLHNNAYYYINTDNPSVYLYSAKYGYYLAQNQERYWIIGSGLTTSVVQETPFGVRPSINYYIPFEYNNTQTILSTQSSYNGRLSTVVKANNTANTVSLTVLKNNIPQYDMTRSSNSFNSYLGVIGSDGLISGVIPVASGDIISINVTYFGEAEPNISGSNPSVSYSLFLGSTIQSGLYYLPTEEERIACDYSSMATRPRGIGARFVDDYTSTASGNNNFPLFIGGEGYIDNYRFTHGATRVQGLRTRTRYSNNFTPATEPFPSVYSDYYPVGNVHNLNRTRYNTIQYFSMNNPATQQPWTTGLIETSGFLFGVKKL